MGDGPLNAVIFVGTPAVGVVGGLVLQASTGTAEACVPFWAVGALAGPLLAGIGILWRALEKSNNRTAERLERLLDQRRGSTE